MQGRVRCLAWVEFYCFFFGFGLAWLGLGRCGERGWEGREGRGLTRLNGLYYGHTLLCLCIFGKFTAPWMVGHTVSALCALLFPSYSFFQLCNKYLPRVVREEILPPLSSGNMGWEQGDRVGFLTRPCCYFQDLSLSAGDARVREVLWVFG